MIVAAGLTPAWQQILALQRLRPGEVNRASCVHWCASGKVLNVGIALSHLGAECVALCPIGGMPGEAIRRDLAALGVPAEWLAVASSTRICTTLLDEATSQTTELVENAGPLSAEELDSYVAAFGRLARAASVVVLSGSLPVGTPASFYCRLLEATPAQTILDVREAELLAALDAGHRPLVIKPNREELATTVGRPLPDDVSLLRAMRALSERGAQWVVVTHGKEAVTIASAREAYCALPPAVPRVVNPIGCGDAMAAAIAWAISQGLEVPQAVRYGMAAAAQNLGDLLPCRLDATATKRLAETIELKRVE